MEAEPLIGVGSSSPELTRLAGGALFPRWVEVTVRALQWHGTDQQELMPSDSHPVVHLRIEVKNGKPVPVYVGIVWPEGREILPSDLRFPFTSWRDLAVQHVAKRVAASQSPPPLAFLTPALADQRQSWEDGVSLAANQAQTAPRRRAVTDDLLREVAQLFLAGLKDGKTTVAVSEGLPTSHRNATRLIGEAKRRGFLSIAGDDKDQEETR